MKKYTTSFIISLLVLTCFIEMAQANSYIDNVPDYLEEGDMLFCDYKQNLDPRAEHGRINDHIAVYIGNNQFIHSDYFRGVEIKNYSYFLENFRYIVFGYVETANISQKLNVVNWLQNKLSCPYQYLKKLLPKGFGNSWYDSELVWAAYYNQGIDIDFNEWKEPKIVEVQDIINDLDVRMYSTHELPDNLKRGDIIVMDVKNVTSYWGIPGYSNDHSALYMGKNFLDGNYFIQASGVGVSYCCFEFFTKKNENFTFYRVKNASQSQIEDTIKWAESHLGAKYQCFFPQFSNPHFWYRGMMELGLKCNDPKNTSVLTSSMFYCNELVWASYYNQGIDIDRNGWEKIKPKAPDQYPPFERKLWDIFGWAFAYVDCEDIKNSPETELIASI